MSKFVFTSESVSEGHPDKVCDAISDAILDNLLAQDPDSRVACETLATTGTVVVSGEVTSKGFVDVERVVKDTLGEIGYTDKAYGMDNETVKVLSMLDKQSPEISQGVDEGSGLHDEQGAGDQGLMFGFACTETKELMPLPIHLSHRLVERMAILRKDGTIPWLRPDSKSQVSVAYKDGKPVSITNVVVATQHDDMMDQFGTESAEHDFVETEMISKIIKPVLDACGLPYEESFIVNGTGRFVFGGPEADTGLTGRKIIVDTYGGYAPHGGGAFSGKDPSKVDRSAAYMARYIAKNIVAAGLAEKCEVQFSYSIGVAEPTSFYVKSFGTGSLADETLTEIAKSIFPLKPGGIIRHLKLKYPRYRQTAANGHFGREIELFTWEKTDMVDALKSAIMKRN
ncbi:MAG: methionine adenosyltransferase [Candidatus Marinimicrobia bacterium]|jgi:S-adenosylmethionine synthetase|nr:methionine adenosyltransferase [Candidatus Neomarinimicrobiota bacterium]MBT3676133.1 methionine adenosyltransferase [Candidatus Neomarinimicrobiota bacterium]MBT4068679.1 methionine adenosyltransferase [Candidatus Neomarinimicrobiota bacterium]MBT4270732.1 methionine adenosyltransferase [Candidatus Neomarinimicrobiota bacterium]MBT4372976.1 methionine adenosyltransferase [Candidatus Neomarinimicrobiota bacterium]